MSSFSQLNHVQPSSQLSLAHTKYHHLTSPKTLRFNSTATNRHTHRFTPRCIGTTAGQGDSDNCPPDKSKPFEKVVMNKNDDELSKQIDSSMSLYKILTIASAFHTKKLLSSLLAFTADHVEFVIKPSAYDGTNLGIKWKLEWKGRQIALGKNCSLNIAHVYNGTLSLRKVNVLIEPIFHPVSKLKRIAMPLLDKLASHTALEGRRRAALYGLTSLLLMTISYILLQKAFV